MVIAKCDCVHEYQDKIHGKGKRLMNEDKSGDVKCTVCGKKSSVSKSEKKGKK